MRCSGIRAVEENGLAVDHPGRPDYITEPQLDSLAALLSSHVGRARAGCDREGCWRVAPQVARRACPVPPAAIHGGLRGRELARLEAEFRTTERWPGLDDDDNTDAEASIAAAERVRQPSPLASRCWAATRRTKTATARRNRS